jgi:hypothetical protein
MAEGSGGLLLCAKATRGPNVPFHLRGVKIKLKSFDT